MKKFAHPAASAALALGLGLASSGANAFLFFGVNEDPGTGGATGPGIDVWANQVDGSYDETITYTSINPDGSINFETQAYAFFSVFRNTADGTVPAQNLTGAPENNTGGYGLEVLFNATGSVSLIPGPPEQVVFSGGTSEFELYLDPGADNGSRFEPVGGTGLLTDPYAINDTDGDDILLGTASSLVKGEGRFFPPPLDIGSFDLIWNDFELTDNDDADPTNDTFAGATAADPDGNDFFVYPDPFHIVLQVDGLVDDINPFSAAELGGLIFACTPVALGGLGDCSQGQFTQELSNSVLQARFLRVPEPGTLALMGISLLGFGAARRMKK